MGSLQASICHCQPEMKQMGSRETLGEILLHGSVCATVMVSSTPASHCWVKVSFGNLGVHVTLGQLWFVVAAAAIIIIVHKEHHNRIFQPLDHWGSSNRSLGDSHWLALLSVFLLTRTATVWRGMPSLDMEAYHETGHPGQPASLAANQPRVSWCSKESRCLQRPQPLIIVFKRGQCFQQPILSPLHVAQVSQNMFSPSCTCLQEMFLRRIPKCHHLCIQPT